MSYKRTIEGGIERAFIESTAHTAAHKNPDVYHRLMTHGASERTVRDLLRALKLAPSDVPYNESMHHAWAEYRLSGTRTSNLSAENWMDHIAGRWFWLFVSTLRELGILAPTDRKRPCMSSEYSGLMAQDFMDRPDFGRLVSAHPIGLEAERTSVSRRERQQILDHQDGECFSCGEEKTVDEVEAHHVMPLEFSRIECREFVALCKRCHRKVYRLTLVQQIDVFAAAKAERMVAFTGGSLDVSDGGEGRAIEVVDGVVRVSTPIAVSLF